MRISDWSSDVCSSDLAATNFFRGRNFTMANKLLLSVTAVALASAALASSPAAAQNRQQKALAAGDYGTIKDRKSVVSGKSVSVRVDLGGRRILKKKQQLKFLLHHTITTKTRGK